MPTKRAVSNFIEGLTHVLHGCDIVYFNRLSSLFLMPYAK